MDNRENERLHRAVQAVDDVTVSVEGYAAVINLTTNLFILVVSVVKKVRPMLNIERRTDSRSS